MAKVLNSDDNEENSNNKNEFTDLENEKSRPNTSASEKSSFSQAP